MTSQYISCTWAFQIDLRDAQYQKQIKHEFTDKRAKRHITQFPRD